MEQVSAVLQQFESGLGGAFEGGHMFWQHICQHDGGGTKEAQGRPDGTAASGAQKRPDGTASGARGRPDGTAAGALGQPSPDSAQGTAMMMAALRAMLPWRVVKGQH